MAIPYPVIWSRCEKCGNPAALFEHDELAYLMSIHNGVAHNSCPTEAELERILTHANPTARSADTLRLAGQPQRLVFTAERGRPRG